jgi:hypothetical protein
MRYLPIVLLCTAFILLPEEVLLFDDFSGEIETDWIFYGDPQPRTIDSLGLPPPCFNNNGDTMWNSGIISRRILDASDGLTVECDVYMTCSERGTWVSVSMELVTPGFRGERSEEEYPLAGMSQQYNGELAWMRPNLQTILNLRWYQTVPGGEIEIYHLNHLLNGWHRYRMEVMPGEPVSYFIDDSLYFIAPVVFPADQDSVRIMLGGQSSDWGIALNDNIRVPR